MTALIMLPQPLDELAATIQFLRCTSRAGRPLWRIFWIGGTDADVPIEPDGARTPDAIGGTIRPFANITRPPWTLLISALIGFWLMAALDLFGMDGALADSTHIAGPLVAATGHHRRGRLGISLPLDSAPERLLRRQARHRRLHRLAPHRAHP